MELEDVCFCFVVGLVVEGEGMEYVVYEKNVRKEKDWVKEVWEGGFLWNVEFWDDGVYGWVLLLVGLFMVCGVNYF